MTRRFLAPEVVQTSSMDCGPAALKCLLEGHGVTASYGRLREACQTSIDGTSIDTIEEVANQLGLIADQVLIPVDHVTLKSATLPAIVVVRHADEATHFVVVWRRHGRWLQIMDPAIGRRWLREREFRDSVFRHRARVAAEDWLAWARGDECREAWRERLAVVGVSGAHADQMIEEAMDRGWRSVAAFDAALRLTAAMVRAGGVEIGKEAASLITALSQQDAEDGASFDVIPKAYWSATPDTDAADFIWITGAVLIQIGGTKAPNVVLPPELHAALTEPPARPLSTLLAMLRQDGVAAPLAVALAAGLAAGVLLLETLLLRGLLDVAGRLTLPVERIGAGVALLLFMALMVAVELAIAGEVLRQGRALELRMRMALLAKLPRLADRYFQSRPISDMADRSHNIQAVRAVPSLAMQCIGAVCEIMFTTIGIAVIAPASIIGSVALALVATALPLCIQPLLNERDLRVRNHAGALNGFYLDALLGLTAIRAHRAQQAVAQQHESLLVEWARSSLGLASLAVTVDGVQALIGAALAIAVIAGHFSGGAAIGGADLLFVYWVLKLPALGARLAAIVQRYPSQRNVLLRLAEPLDAPEEAAGVSGSVSRPGAASIAMDQVSVVAAGHAILADVSLSIAPGEHVAIVGTSGAGKSTLLGLLLGWHRPALGTLSVDNAPLDATALAALRRSTAWVDPAIQIWNRSLVDNLLYQIDAPALDRVGAIMSAAHLRGVARTLPDGLQSLLGEGGALLSGGEGQRVRLGRALAIPETRLVLLDEPFRGLDRGQRRTLLAEARRWWREATLLCVTHDIVETREFPRVLVVEDGRVIEDGTPETLATTPSRYRDLLAAEGELRETLWCAPDWRRWTLADGKIIETASR